MACPWVFALFVAGMILRDRLNAANDVKWQRAHRAEGILCELFVEVIKQQK